MMLPPDASYRLASLGMVVSFFTGIASPATTGEPKLTGATLQKPVPGRCGDAIGNDQLTRDEEAANQNGTKESFASAGFHLQQKLAEPFVVEKETEGVNGLNLIPANNGCT